VPAAIVPVGPAGDDAAKNAGSGAVAAPGGSPAARTACFIATAAGVIATAAESELPFDIVRRPSGGRAVLHGADFEWSFAVVFPPGAARNGNRVDTTYALVSAAMADALRAAGVTLTAEREEPYRRSALCFATSLRHDLHAAAGKVVAVAQVRRGGATLVHGSVMERRPPAMLTDVVERLVGEPWSGEGMNALRMGAEAAIGRAGGTEGGSPTERSCVDADRLWALFVGALQARLA
jgi:hypothetical protein